MNFFISDKMASLKPSAIREIFKYAQDPAVISLAAGSPAAEAFPVEAIQNLMQQVMAEHPYTALQYSQSEGYPPFREALRKYLREKQSFAEYDDVLVVSGAQQCMDLACKVLLNEGDVILCEEPSFVGSLNTFRSYGAKLKGIPLQEDGINIEALEAALQETPRVRMVYVIPNFQNPTGITMSLAKRKAVYELAQRYNVLILEDNPYGDLRFAGEPLPNIKSMDTEGRVLYAGTFSKILSPGIRVGYLATHKDVMAKLVVAKQCADVHTGMLSQLLAHTFLQTCDLKAHIAGIQAIYARKCGLMLKELEAQTKGKLTFTRPEGGLFVWATLPNTDDSGEFCTRLVKEQKVAVVPGSAFCIEENAKTSAFRLNFSAPTDENIVEGVRRVAAQL